MIRPGGGAAVNLCITQRWVVTWAVYFLIAREMKSEVNG